MYSIAIRSAKPPANWSAELSTPSPLPPRPRSSDWAALGLLRRRPDVREADANSRPRPPGSVWRKRNGFPTLPYRGRRCRERQPDQMVRAGQPFWSLGPSVQWRIFDFGRVARRFRRRPPIRERRSGGATKRSRWSRCRRRRTPSSPMRRSKTATRRSPARRLKTGGRWQWRPSVYEGSVNFLDVLDAQRSLYQSDDELAASDQAVSTRSRHSLQGAGRRLGDVTKPVMCNDGASRLSRP